MKIVSRATDLVKILSQATDLVKIVSQATDFVKIVSQATDLVFSALSSKAEEFVIQSGIHRLGQFNSYLQ